MRVRKPRNRGGWKQDRRIVGQEYVQVCLSMPLGDLADVDLHASKACMARSHFIRVALLFYLEYLQMAEGGRAVVIKPK